jgi:outer membrane protein assembly factor BamB
VARVTTICCSLIAFLALAKPPDPIALLPLRGVWKLALNSHLAWPPAYDALHAYFAIEGDRLVAYDVASGKQLWLVDVRSTQPPVAGRDVVLIVADDHLDARKPTDGTSAWRAELGEPLAVKPVAADGWIVAATKAGSLLAFREADGEKIWQQDLGMALQAPPTIYRDRLYVPLSDGRIAARELKTGDPLWEGRIAGSPNEILATDDRLYVGSTDNFLYCLLTKDGRKDWRWRTGGDIAAKPVADNRAVYFVSFDNIIRALGLKSGGQYWMKPLPFRPTFGVRLSGSTIVVAGQSATVKTFNARDGAPGIDIPAGDEVVAPPQVLQEASTGLPMLALVTRHIVNADSVSLSARTMDPAATPFVPLANPVTPVPMQATRP